MYVLNHEVLKCTNRNKPNLKETNESRSSIKNLSIFYHKYTDTDKILANI